MTDEQNTTEEQLYDTYELPFDANIGYPQEHRISIYNSIFKITYNFNFVSKMPILILSNASGEIYTIRQLVPYYVYYIQDTTTGVGIMSIITREISKDQIVGYMAINRNWNGYQIPIGDI